jgi:hypothetical protein
LDAIEDDLHKEVKVARTKYKGTGELLNLKTSINYGDDLTSNRQRERQGARTASLSLFLGLRWEGFNFRAYGVGRAFVFCHRMRGLLS